VEDSNLRPWH